MLLELGPVAGEEVQRWSRTLRRIVIELRNDPCELEGIATDDLLSSWTRLVDRWPDSVTEPASFRWSESIDSELAEYLLHGLERCLCSPTVGNLVTDQEIAETAGFTMHLIDALVTGLVAEDRQCEHYADRLRSALDNHGLTRTGS